MKKALEEAKLELILVNNDIITTSTKEAGAGGGTGSGDGNEL